MDTLINYAPKIVQHGYEEHGAIGEFVLWAGCILIILAVIVVWRTLDRNSKREKRLEDAIFAQLDSIAEAQKETERQLWQRIPASDSNTNSEGGDQKGNE